LVGELFRLINSGQEKPEWLVIENVPYMLKLGSGEAMNVLTSNVEALGYKWCYRTIDARAFGTPQRRPRVLFVASLHHDPRQILFSQDAGDLELDSKPSVIDDKTLYGFYWTEGSRGVGWACESVPPIKGGSGIGIPSPPAVWIPYNDFFGTISIGDAERLQGFPIGWTSSVENLQDVRASARWRLIGNAVNAQMSVWLAEQFFNPLRTDTYSGSLKIKKSWPRAAWGCKGEVYQSDSSLYPVYLPRQNLKSFLIDELKPLSERAARGFLSRTKKCTNVVYSPKFITSLERYIKNL
jgi:DNA (cytosine-5)-methyltransferase 1